MSGVLAGKVALITGATSGIGRGAALGIAAAGAQVALCGRRMAEGLETERLIRERGGEAAFFQTDISNAAQVEQLVARTVERFGRLDCALNNAGIGHAPVLLADATEEQYERVFGVNARGVWLCMKYQIRQFLAQDSGGSIANVSSAQAHIAIGRSGHYTASKHAVEGYTKLAAVDYALQKIRVNSLALGAFEGMAGHEYPQKIKDFFKLRQPLGRLATYDDAAQAAIFLLSDKSSFITGTCLRVDGGWLINA
jgi:NAD(P)-dependent dehydrogenase (short-subunit alcohol dehydrogenase family)